VSIPGVPRTREDRAEEIRCRHQKQNQRRDLERLDQSILQFPPGQSPVGERQQQRSGGTHARTLGGGRKSEQDAAEGRKYERGGGNETFAEFREYVTHAVGAILLGEHRAEGGIQVAAKQRVAGVQEREQKAGHDRRGEQIRHRNFQNRPCPPDGALLPGALFWRCKRFHLCAKIVVVTAECQLRARTGDAGLPSSTALPAQPPDFQEKPYRHDGS
jgi:hypothetical protein